MGHSFFVVVLIISMFILGGNCQTIDEIILLSQEHRADSDLFRDNETVKVELDMLFKADEYARMYEQDIEAERSEQEGRSSRKKRKAVRYESKRWTDNIIPYYISSGFSQADKAQIQSAVDDWNRNTCLYLRPHRSGDTNYVSIKGGGGCSSYVGMSGGAQPLTLGRFCRRKGIIAHEFGHALGFHHEQTRPDRDRYVQIFYQNIQQGMEYNFQRHSTSVINNHGVPYDYLSIMHYGKTAFTKDGSLTISTIDSSYQNIIGTRQTLSFKDVKLANLMYKCGSHCGTKTCPGDGFVGQDCKCYCPGNPAKLCDGGGGGGGGDKDCKDNHPNCASWAALGECGDSGVTPPGAWMAVHCRLSCKKCTGGGGGTTTPRPTPRPTTPRPITPRPTTPRPITPRPTTGGGNCKDNHVRCASWAESGACVTDTGVTPPRAWMVIHCKVTCNRCTVTSTPRPTATTPRPTTNCKDNHGNCPEWAAISDCDGNGATPTKAWMEVHCKLSCNICTGGGGTGGGTPRPPTPRPPTPRPTTPRPTPRCTDKNQYCGYWKSQGHCTSAAYVSYMRINCPSSCNVCTTGGGSPPTPSPSCRDNSGSCPYWASIGECHRNPAYMLQSCKKSCRRC